MRASGKLDAIGVTCGFQIPKVSPSPQLVEGVVQDVGRCTGCRAMSGVPDIFATNKFLAISRERLIHIEKEDD